MLKKISIVSMIAIIALFAVPVLAAPNFLSSDTGVINITSPVGDDTYITGSRVIVDRDIDGDLIIIGGEVEINGNIAGDLLVVATTVLIKGNIGDDLRVGGGEVLIESEIGDDVIVGGGIVTISETALVKGDLIAGSSDFFFDGMVLGSLKAGFDQGVINGIIKGDANLKYGGILSFGDDAVIAGKLVYWASAPDSNFGTVAGSVEYNKWSDGQGISYIPILGAFAFLIPPIAFGALVWKYLGMMLLGSILIWFLPKYMPRVVDLVKKNYWSSFWQGIVFLVVVPILALIGIIVLIGIPLSIILMLSYIIIVMISGIVASLVIGSYFVKLKKPNKKQQLAGLAVGTAVYVLLGLVPFVGWLIKFVFMVLALGGVWRDSYTAIKTGRY